MIFILHSSSSSSSTTEEDALQLQLRLFHQGFSKKDISIVSSFPSFSSMTADWSLHLIPPLYCHVHFRSMWKRIHHSRRRRHTHKKEDSVYCVSDTPDKPTTYQGALLHGSFQVLEEENTPWLLFANQSIKDPFLYDFMRFPAFEKPMFPYYEYFFTHRYYEAPFSFQHENLISYPQKKKLMDHLFRYFHPFCLVFFISSSSSSSPSPSDVLSFCYQIVHHHAAYPYFRILFISKPSFFEGFPLKTISRLYPIQFLECTFGCENDKYEDATSLSQHVIPLLTATTGDSPYRLLKYEWIYSCHLTTFLSMKMMDLFKWSLYPPKYSPMIQPSQVWIDSILPHVSHLEQLKDDHCRLPSFCPFFKRLEYCLKRQEIEEGLQWMEAHSSSPRTLSFSSHEEYRWITSKISFLSIQQNFPALQMELIQYLKKFSMDDNVELLKYLRIIIQHCESNLIPEIRLMFYKKLVMDHSDAFSWEENILHLCKMTMLPNLTVQDVNGMIAQYKYWSTTLFPSSMDPRSNPTKLCLVLLFRKMALEFSQESCVMELISIVCKSFPANLYTFTNEKQFQSIYRSYFEPFYPELLLKLCDYMDPYLSTTSLILKRRQQITRTYQILLKAWEKTYRLEDVVDFVVSNFSLSYHGIPSKSLFQLKSCFVRKICPELNYTFVPQQQETTEVILKPQPQKRRIGFLSAFLSRQHSVFKDRHMIIRKLAEDPDLSSEHIEIVFFTLDPLDENVKQAYGRSPRHIQFPSPPQLSTMRETLLSTPCDILIYCEIGMHPLLYFLAHMRLAPIQINTWGHSDTSGISTIDYFMTSQYYELPNLDIVQRDHYSEKVVALPSLCTYYKNPLSRYRNTSSTMVWESRSAFGFSEKVHLYLCPQSIFKFHPEYDDYLSEILLKDKQGILVILDAMGKKEKLLDRWSLRWKDPSILLTRVHFISSGIPHFRYLNLIRICDVMLDTFPFGGCNSSLEAFSLHKIVVTHPSCMINGRFTYGFYKKMGLEKECVCYSKSQYVSFAVKMASHPKIREAIENVIKIRHGCLFEDESSFLDWKRFLQEKITVL